MATTIKTLIKSSLQGSTGKRVADISDEIGVPYANTYQTIKSMCEDGLVNKIARGVYVLDQIPHFTTSECISLLQGLESHELAVEIAREELDRAEARLQSVKRTIRQTMLTSFDD